MGGSIGFDPTDVLLSGDVNGDGRDDLVLLRPQARQGLRGAVRRDAVRHARRVAQLLRGLDLRAAAGGGRHGRRPRRHRHLRDRLAHRLRRRVRGAVGRHAVRRPGREAGRVGQVARLVRGPADGAGPRRRPRRGPEGGLLHLPAAALRPVLHRAVAGHQHGRKRAVAGERWLGLDATCRSWATPTATARPTSSSSPRARERSASRSGARSGEPAPGRRLSARGRARRW